MRTMHTLRWPSEPLPQEDLCQALEDYIGIGDARGELGRVRHDGDTLIVNIQGRSSHPLMRIGSPRVTRRNMTIGRGFRVVCNETEIVVSCLTQSDPVTFAIMRGFVDFCKKSWEMQETSDKRKEA